MLKLRNRHVAQYPALSKGRRRGKWLSILACLVLFISLFNFLFFKSPRAHAQTDTFTVSGSWSVPGGVSSAVFEAWGGGGAGGGTASGGAGGGAGGQYAKKTLTGLVANDSYTIAVSGATSGSTGAGSPGGDSSVTSPLSTTVVLAKGGAGGGAGANGAGGTGSTSSGIGDTIFAGGNGAAGTSALGGAGGGGAGSGGAGGSASGATAGTGTSTNGGNGGAGITAKGAGNAGSNYGGGGGGALRTNGGGQTGGTGAAGLVTITYTANSSPSSPTLIAPAASATGVSTTPVFTLRTTDAEGDYLKYRIYLYQSDCTTAVGSSPFDMSGAGWSGMDANTNTAYVGSATLTSSTIATYTYQGTLSTSTTYCWKADAIDPGGSNTYGSVSATQSFTTGTGAPTTDQAMRGGEYFSSGSKQPYYWAQ